MPLVVTDAGEKAFIDALLKGDVSKLPRKLRLFTDAQNIGPHSAPEDFDGATAPGLGEVTLNPANWHTGASLNGRAVGQYGSVALQFENTGDELETVYGFLVLTEDGVTLLWGERFSDPIDVAPEGVLQVWPVFTGRSEY